MCNLRAEANENRKNAGQTGFPNIARWTPQPTCDNFKDIWERSNPHVQATAPTEDRQQEAQGPTGSSQALNTPGQVCSRSPLAVGWSASMRPSSASGDALLRTAG